MTELLLYLLVFVIGWAYGYFRTISTVIKRTNENPAKLRKILEDIEVKRRAEEITGLENAQEVKIEKIGNQIYIWSKITNEFISQGPTLEKAIEIAQIRFPNTTYFHEATPES